MSSADELSDVLEALDLRAQVGELADERVDKHGFPSVAGMGGRGRRT